MRSTLSLISFPNVAFETAVLFQATLPCFSQHCSVSANTALFQSTLLRFSQHCLVSANTALFQPTLPCFSQFCSVSANMTSFSQHCSVSAYLVSAVSLVLMSHQQCSEVAAVVSLLVLAVGIMGLANTGGFYVNPYDIAPRFATSICTATNTMATVTGIINPYIVAIITKDVSV